MTAAAERGGHRRPVLQRGAPDRRARLRWRWRRAGEVRLLFVDDGSTDATAGILDRVGRESGRDRGLQPGVEHRKGRGGPARPSRRAARRGRRGGVLRRRSGHAARGARCGSSASSEQPTRAVRRARPAGWPGWAARSSATPCATTWDAPTPPSRPSPSGSPCTTPSAGPRSSASTTPSWRRWPSRSGRRGPSTWSCSHRLLRGNAHAPGLPVTSFVELPLGGLARRHGLEDATRARPWRHCSTCVPIARRGARWGRPDRGPASKPGAMAMAPRRPRGAGEPRRDPRGNAGSREAGLSSPDRPTATLGKPRGNAQVGRQM